MKNPFSLFRKSEAPTEKKFTIDDVATGLLGWFGFGTHAKVAVNEVSALQVPAVFCAARVISEGVSGMPVTLKEEKFDSEGRVKIRARRDHWAHKLISKRPNSWQTPAEFIEGMTFVAAIAGTAIAIKNTVRGEVKELLPVPPGGFTVEQDSKWGLIYRVHLTDKVHKDFTKDQVMVLRGPGVDGFQGLPAIRMAKEAIGLSIVLEKQQAKLAGNGGKPSGIVAFDNPLKPDQVEQFRKNWNEKFGPDGEGGIAILDSMAKFYPMTMTSVDAQTLESRRFQIEEIARAFRVLPTMLMQQDKAATFASAEQMARVHVTHTLMPWVNRWEQVLNRDLLSRVEDLYFDFDETLLLRGDHKDQADVFVKALGAGGTPGWMTQNEVRERMGLEPSTDPMANKIPSGSMSENLNNATSPDQENGDAA